MMNLLYAGFDTFDFALKGALPESVLEQLDVGRAEAEKREEPVLIHIGPNKIPAHIKEHGRKRGYRFLLNTGDLGAEWMIKRNADPNQWNFFVSPAATALLALGYKEVFTQVVTAIEDMGGWVTGHSINRIDFAMDFETRGFEPHPEQVVAHSHSKVAPHWGAKKSSEDQDQPSTVFRGRRVESITIGKQPGRQIIIYDKRREAIACKKHHWFKVWGKDRTDKTLEVWRIEVRGGKKELKDKYRISTIADFDASVGDVILNSLNAIRYVADGQADGNISRQSTHPLWEQAREIAAQDLNEFRSGLTPGQVKEVACEKAQDTYLALCTGNAVGLAIAKGLCDDEIEVQLPELVASEVARRLKSSGYDLYKAIRRTRERLVFLDLA